MRGPTTEATRVTGEDTSTQLSGINGTRHAVSLNPQQIRLITVRHTFDHACPCGETHPLSRHASEIIRLCGDRIAIQNPHGAWRVPRVFIFAHGMESSQLAAAAELYGFERIIADPRPKRTRQP